MTRQLSKNYYGINFDKKKANESCSSVPQLTDNDHDDDHGHTSQFTDDDGDADDGQCSKIPFFKDFSNFDGDDDGGGRGGNTCRQILANTRNWEIPAGKPPPKERCGEI